MDTGHGVIQRRDEPRLLRDCDDDDDVGQTDAQKNRRTDGRTDGQQTDILTPPVPLAAIQIFAFQLGAPMHRRAGGCAERTLAPVRLSFDEGRRLNHAKLSDHFFLLHISNEDILTFCRIKQNTTCDNSKLHGLAYTITQYNTIQNL